MNTAYSSFFDFIFFKQHWYNDWHITGPKFRLPEFGKILLQLILPQTV